MAKAKGGGISKISSAELSKARRAGFKTAKPDKPKRDATAAQLKGYIKRHNRWVASGKKKARDEASRLKLRRKIFGS